MVATCACRRDRLNAQLRDSTSWCEPFLGDVNLDGVVNLLDIEPFIQLITNSAFQAEADINQDGTVDLLDVEGFVAIISDG